MSAVSVCLVLAIVLALMLRGNGLRPVPMVVAIIFGLVLGSTPAGPMVNRALGATGSWIWAHGRSL